MPGPGELTTEAVDLADPEEGHPPGTVFLGLSTPHGVEVAEHHFDGDPTTVILQSTVQALTMLLSTLRVG